MKEPYGEGVASHTDPESCMVSREAGREALTRAHVDGVLRREMTGIRMPTLFIRREGNIGGRVIASTRWTCEVKDPRYAWNLHARERGDPSNARHEAVDGPVGEGDEPQSRT